MRWWRGGYGGVRIDLLRDETHASRKERSNRGRIEIMRDKDRKGSGEI